MGTGTDKQKLSIWKEFAEGIRNSTPVDTTEKTTDKIARIKRLEADDEAWFAYYFPKYSQKPDGTPSPPAQFHKDATKRVMAHPEWVEVRNWSRELAKSTRTMMEVMKLCLVGNPVTLSLSKGAVSNVKYSRKRNILLVSNSLENAARLLAPYKVNFEANNRIINDYGQQENLGAWTDTEFITKSGVAFRAIGAGQSPRGTRNEAIRPDVILIDDIDTDEDCRNGDIIDKRWAWIGEALIPTRSISNPLLVIWCGNIIAEDCCVVRAAERADHVDVVNIRNKDGKSSWPEKNSEADIDRVLSTISYASAQKEYFNNPMSTGKTFPVITWGKCPPIHTLQFAICYADPAPGNKDRPGAKTTQGNSRKAAFIVGRKGNRYYIYYGFLDVVGSDRFIRFLYDCRSYFQQANQGGATSAAYFTYIENNSLQDPFYDQVYRRIIVDMAANYNHDVLSITPDTEKKPEKWFRIEADLEPINTRGDLIFNEDEKNNEHMKRLAAQFLAAKPNSKELDGPDCIQGAVRKINQKANETTDGAIRGTRHQRSSSKGY